MQMQNNRRWWILGAMGAILGVILLDETVVGVALPSIQKDLGLSGLTAHWVVNVYLLVLAGLAGAAGRLGDILGARRLMSLGLTIFGVSSALGGFADSGTALILARAAQGLGAAIIFPLSLMLITLSFHEGERGLALGLYGTIGTSLMAMGPIVGGALTEYLSWRWIFWINPPIVLIVAVITLAFWRDPPHRSEPRFDWKGLFLLVGGLALVIFGIMEGPDRGWVQPDVLIPLGTGLLMLVLFVPAEAGFPTPIIAVHLFKSSHFLASNLIVFTAQFVKISLLVFGAMFFQTRMGFSPLQSGAALLPAVVPQVLIATFAGKAADRFGTRRPSLLGVLGASAAITVVAVGMETGNSSLMFGGLLFWGFSVPFLFVPPRHAVMAAVPVEMQGQAGGIVMSSQLLGGTLGMAVCSTVFSSTNSIAAVFWVTAAFAVAVFVYGYFALEKPAGKSVR